MVLAEVVGNTSFGDMKNYLHTLVNDPLYKPGMNSFYDLTKCPNIEGDLSDLSEFTKSLRDSDKSFPSCKTSILLPNGNDTLRNVVKGIVLMTSASRIEHRYFLEPNRFLALKFIGLNEMYGNPLVQNVRNDKKKFQRLDP